MHVILPEARGALSCAYSFIRHSYLLLVLLFYLLIVHPAFCYGFPRCITDKTDFPLVLSRPPLRIITLGPSVTEVVFSLGAGDKIVGVSSSSNYPPEALSKEKVGDIYLNYEKIVALRPDLVIVETSIFPRTTTKLRSLSLPTLAIQSDTYENFLDSVNLVAKALGEEKRAQMLLSKLQRNMDGISQRIKNIPLNKRPRVFIEIWNKPLMTAGSGTFVNYIIEKAGGVNVADDMKGFPQINMETFLVRDPEVIILTTSTREEFMTCKYWRNISAVKNGRVHIINPDIMIRPTLRIYESCAILYKLFYPGMRISPNKN